MQNKLKYLIALNHFPKFGPIRLKKLKNYFGNFQKAFKASPQELIKAGIENKVAYEFISARINIQPRDILEKLSRENIKITTYDSHNYPQLLKEIYDPPQLLYYKGKISREECAIAIVGSRKHTSYGEQAIEKIVPKLAKNNITIVSGLAIGIDSLVHNTTLNNGGRTIAVLGTGLDQSSIYPSSNRFLAEKIVTNGGAIISEFPLGTQPLRYNFPQRNRIISGLSLGTIVIEAAEKSGALITAKHALEQNREVFSLPGSIFSPISIGPNYLIKQGAKAITSSEDIMETLNLKQINEQIENKKIIAETKEEKLILPHLSHEAMHINELIRLSGLDTNVINSTLTIMEMKGIVKNLGSMMYIKKIN